MNMICKRGFARLMAVVLMGAVLAMTAPVAEAKALTPQQIHARILKRGLGNWVGVELLNGTAIVGRIVSVDEETFGLQLHNDPGVTPIRYADVVKLHTGISNGAFWGITVAGICGVAAMAAIGFHEVHEHQQMPTVPTTPLFP